MKSSKLFKLGVFLFAGSIAWSGYIAFVSRRSIPISRIIISSDAFQAVEDGSLRIEAQQAFDKADKELLRRATTAKAFRDFANLLECAGLLLGSFATLLAGYCGRPLNPGPAKDAVTIEDVLGREAKSKKETRLIGVLLATILVVNFAADRVNSMGVKAQASMQEFHRVLVQREKDFHDANSEQDRRNILRDLAIDITQ